MPRRVPFQANSYYHVYNRGLNKKTIFYSDADYQRFLRNMEKYLEKFAIDLIAYCLLPNHFHLIIKNHKEGFDLSQYLALLSVSYVRYFKKRYEVEEKGLQFFEQRFHAKELVDEEYLATAIHYVTHNAHKRALISSREVWPEAGD